MPGMGGSAAHWIAYVQARHTEKGGTETFGKGDVRGIISSDAAVNAVDGAELIPTVVFGIPSGGGMAILLAILILSGVQPGPAMLTTHLDLTLSLVYTVVIANVITIPIMVFAGPYILRLAVIPPNILAPDRDRLCHAGRLPSHFFHGRSPVGPCLRNTWRVHEALWMAATADSDGRGALPNRGKIFVDFDEYLRFSNALPPAILVHHALMAVVIIASMRLQTKARKAEMAIVGAAKDA